MSQLLTPVQWNRIIRAQERSADQALKSLARLTKRLDRHFVRACEDDPIVRPPDSMTAYDDRDVVLYTADERPLIRRAGF